jgi:hypothetical protein
MKNRKKRKQREEVRKILNNMHQELAERRLIQEQDKTKESTLHLNEMIKKVSTT